MSTGALHNELEFEAVTPPPNEPDYVPAGHDCSTITEKISSLVLTERTTLGWLAFLALNAALLATFGGVVVYLLVEGVGIWGIDIPVAWGFSITDFVWWIGIGHAGTLISAILLLLHQKWRTSINRIAEAMTIFAVMCAGMFPLLHLGRPWFFYWLLPYPNTMRPLAAIPQRRGLGRIRRQHVLHGVIDLLVPGHDSGLGHAAAIERRLVVPK